MNYPIIAPSLLSADFSDMEQALALIEKSGGDWVHFDVMDGSFVPDITFGHKMVNDMRKRSDLPFDVHLMVYHPETQVEKFAHAGADYITIQVEATIHLHSVIMQIKELGKKAGISIVPSTQPGRIKELLCFVDLVLIMTVNPGYGGQKLIHETLEKVVELKELKKNKNYNFIIEIDGGVNRETCGTVLKAGPEAIVTGSAFFDDKDPAAYIRLFKK
ncbi:MAG: ribulose-phosphate 3-epimerase [Spirochaetales bacterium]|nr:ribulose-phosphate 3-epimerase [Spirochaetales bacterium]